MLIPIYSLHGPVNFYHKEAMAHSLNKLVFVLLFLVKNIWCQWVSPCPRYFSYEPRDPTINDRWYGQIILNSDSDLSGVWIRLAFDKPTLQLGNWFGRVERKEANEFLIENPKQKLMTNTPKTIRFFVRYNPTETPPKFTGFRLNAKQYCPENSPTTVPPLTQQELFINSDSDSGGGNGVNSNGVGGGGNWNGGNTVGGNPGGGNRNPRPSIPNGVGNDDVFPGDFNLNNQPSTDDLNVACGTVIQPPRPLITHAELTHEAEFPWHAALYHAAGIDLTYICGASLISKQHLVTVAHCVTKRGSATTLSPDSLVVYLGKYYLKRWSNPGIQDRQVSQIFRHPNYNSQMYSADIAILKLASPVDITNYVRPVCLWDKDSSLQTVVGTLGSVAGWGYNEKGIVSDQLMKANMPIVSQEICIYSFPDFFSRFTNSKTYCAGYRNGTSVCNGDSGGGMVIPRKTGPSQVFYLRGLVSISVALQNSFKCDANHFVVFTDVSKYVDWIRSVVR